MSKNKLSAYIELTKPRIVIMVLVTATIGYYLTPGEHHFITLLYTLLGIWGAAGGSSVLNNYLERESDAKMERTKNRPLPSGLISPANGLGFGIILILAGVLLILWQVNTLTAFLVLLAAFLYSLVYTPLKPITWWNTPIGAIPGAIPPMAGWTAATGNVGVEAWILFFILFAWQHPHFYSIAWMLRKDYEQAGLKMLPVVQPEGKNLVFQVIFFSVLLIIFSVLPTSLGIAGNFYLFGAILIGLFFLHKGVIFALQKNDSNARQLLKASVIYLPLWLILILVDTHIMMPK